MTVISGCPEALQKDLKKKINRGHPVKLTLSVVMTVLFVHEEAGMG